MSDRIKELLNRIPYRLLVVLYLAYIAFDFLGMGSDPNSIVYQKKEKIKQTKNEIESLQTQLKEAKAFYQKIDKKKQKIRRLAKQLNNAKAQLSNKLDTPEFIKTVVSEAKEVGLNVISIKPSGREEKNYYVSQSFSLKFRGLYAQLLVFMKNLNKNAKILRMDNFNLNPVGVTGGKYVELEGDVELKTYFYNRSKADKVSKDLAKSSSS